MLRLVYFAISKHYLTLTNFFQWSMLAAPREWVGEWTAWGQEASSHFAVGLLTTKTERQAVDTDFEEAEL